jgi:predicted ATP-dependent protease
MTNSKESHALKPQDIQAFEQRHQLNYDARRENLVGLDRIANKRDILIEILHTIVLNDSKFNILLFGPPGYGKVATLEAVIEELNETAKQGLPLTIDPELARLAEARVASFKNQLHESACVYDFPSGSLRHLYFKDRGAASDFASDVRIFLETLIERWKENLLETPKRPRFYIDSARAALSARIRMEYEGLRFKLKPLKEDEFGIDFDRRHKATREKTEVEPSQAERIKARFFKGHFQAAYDAYKAEIRPEVIAGKHRHTQATMNRNLLDEERLLRSRLKLDSLTLSDTAKLELHRQYYPTTEQKLIQLYVAVLKEKYSADQEICDWMDSLCRFLIQPSAIKVLDAGLAGDGTYEISVGGKEVTLLELVRPKVDCDLSQRKSFILSQRMEHPTGSSLFGYVNSDLHTPPQHGVELGALAKNHIVILDNLHPILQDDTLYSLLLSFLLHKKYTLQGLNVQVEVSSPCILVVSAGREELNEYPLLKQRFQEIVFPTTHPVSKDSLSGFAQVINRGVAEYNRKDRRNGIRPFTKRGRGIDALARCAIASTGYADLMSAQYGIFLKEALAIARRKEEGDVGFEDVVSYFARRREREENFHRARRLFIEYDPDFFLNDEVGQGVGLFLWPGSSGVPFSAFASPVLLGVSAHPGMGKMYSTGKGILEGEQTQKANEVVFATLRKLIDHTHFDLSVDLIGEYEGSDGPSASAAVTYTALSAISRVPMTSRIAITGTLGDFSLRVGYIGGVMDKTYGWYRTARELAARHELPFEEQGFGVLVPRSNLEELLLYLPFYPDLQRDLSSKAFTIHTHRSIRDGLDLLFPGYGADMILARAREHAAWLTEQSWRARRGGRPLRTRERTAGSPVRGDVSSIASPRSDRPESEN